MKGLAASEAPPSPDSSGPVPSPTAAPARKRRALALASVLLLALLLRLAAASGASLHLDDFHSLHHARSPDWPSFFRVLAQDNHPPLSFAILRGVRAWLGEGAFALRLPAVLFGVWLVALAWRLAGRFAAPEQPLSAAGPAPSGGALRVQVGAALFVACSSLALEGSSDLRMYAALAVAVSGLTDATVGALRGRGGALAAGFYAWLGLHTHYHFVHALLVLGLAVLVALALDAGARREARQRPAPGARRLAVALTVALALSLPWYLWGFRAQLGHDLPPGGSSVSPVRLAQSYVHLGLHETRVAPAQLAPLLLGAGALGAVLAGLGWLARLRERPRAAGTLVLGAAAFALPAWSALVAALVPRAGYEWRYVVGSLAPFGVCFALGAFGPGALGRLRSVAGGLALSAALLLSLLHVADPGRENYRDAVRYVLERAGPDDAVVAADWQPRLFPHSGAWRYYAERTRPAEALPHRVEYTDDFALAGEAPRPGLDGAPRVFAILRSVPDGVALLRELRARYAREEKALFGEAVWVLTFEEPR